MKKMCVILPTLNEAENITQMVHGVTSVLKKIPDISFVVLVVDSNSSDETASIVRKLARNTTTLKLVTASHPGLGYALRLGLREAYKNHHADFAITLDADGSHHPKYLPNIAATLDSSNLVVGSRYGDEGKIKDWPLYRRWISSTGNWLLGKLIGLPDVSDYTSNYRGYSKLALEALATAPLPSDWSFLCASLLACKTQKMSIQEIPILFSDRLHGKSKLDPIKYSVALLTLAFSYRIKRMHTIVSGFTYSFLQ